MFEATALPTEPHPIPNFAFHIRNVTHHVTPNTDMMLSEQKDILRSNVNDHVQDIDNATIQSDARAWIQDVA